MAFLANKVALVTGGAQGIGLAICEALADAGCSVVLADIRPERMRQAVEKVALLGHPAGTVLVDVTQEQSVCEMVRRTKQARGRIDILVNSAGVAPNIGPAIRLSLAEWTRVLSVNLQGVFLCCREVGALMVEQGGGRIINIASLDAISPAALTLAYNVAKAGVVSLTRTLAVELAPFSVTVNSVSPGPVETEFYDTILAQCAAALGVSQEAVVEKLRASIPLGRLGTPDDVAKAVLFLASDQADWITGQNLVVAGGLPGAAVAPNKDIILGKSKSVAGVR